MIFHRIRFNGNGHYTYMSLMRKIMWRSVWSVSVWFGVQNLLWGATSLSWRSCPHMRWAVSSQWKFRASCIVCMAFFIGSIQWNERKKKKNRNKIQWKHFNYIDFSLNSISDSNYNAKIFCYFLTAIVFKFIIATARFKGTLTL